MIICFFTNICEIVLHKEFQCSRFTDTKFSPLVLHIWLCCVDHMMPFLFLCPTLVTLQLMLATRSVAFNNEDNTTTHLPGLHICQIFFTRPGVLTRGPIHNCHLILTMGILPTTSYCSCQNTGIPSVSVFDQNILFYIFVHCRTIW